MPQDDREHLSVMMNELGNGERKRKRDLVLEQTNKDGSDQIVEAAWQTNGRDLNGQTISFAFYSLYAIQLDRR